MNRFRQCVRFIRWHLGHTLPMVVRHDSTYPELPRKSAVRRWFENLYIYLRDGSPCAAYDGLGLDVKGRRLDDFVSDLRWIRFLYRKLVTERLASGTPMQRLTLMSTSPIHLLQDKYCFWSLMERHGIPAVPVLAHTVGGRMFDMAKRDEWMARGDVFVKPVAANCGKRAFRLSVRDGRFLSRDGREMTLEELLADGEDYVFQPLVENHSSIKALNSSTLNTVRLVTCRRADGTVGLLTSGTMRIGRASSDVDNFAEGGVSIGIDESGRLLRFGYLRDANLNYTKTDRHPDSQVVFEGRAVPFYNESAALVQRAHGLFPALKTIGWDVAVTEDGPMLLEGNHDWSVEGLQVAHHKGYRARLREIYFP